MKTVTLDILNDHAFNLLKDLEKLKVIRLRKDNAQKTDIVEAKKVEAKKVEAKKKVSFRALSIDTKKLNFNREEANER